jgi:hypothetical protein
MTIDSAQCSSQGPAVICSFAVQADVEECRFSPVLPGICLFAIDSLPEGTFLVIGIVGALKGWTRQNLKQFAAEKFQNPVQLYRNVTSCHNLDLQQPLIAESIISAIQM